jgi:MATE family multidrug resistance protein
MNRKILNLAIPNIISNITVPLLGIVDLTLMGRLGDERYIGAIALGGMIFNFVYWGFVFLRMGTSGFTAQAFGKNDQKESVNILSRAMLVGLIGSFVVIVLQWPIERLGFWLIDGSRDVEEFARSYYYIRIWAAPATIMLYAFTGWFIGMQNARIPMIVAIVINLLNVGFNVVFVFGFGMKSDGVAWGTLLAQYSGLGLSIYYFRKKFGYMIALWERKAMTNLVALRRFFMVNKDIFIRTLALIFAVSFFTTKSAETNDTILAINTILFQFFIFFSYFVDGFANAGEALAGRYIGAGDRPNLLRSVKLTFVWALGVSVIFTLINAGVGKWILQLMTSNTEIVSGAIPFLPWVVLIPLISFVAFIWDGIYVGATVSNHMRNSILVALLVFLIIYYATIDALDNHGLWLALSAFLLVRGIYLSVFARRSVLSKSIMGN